MGEKRQPPRSTQKLDSAELARMARASTGDARDDEGVADENDWQDVEVAVGSQANVAPIAARTTTVADPMTMALLAEVARNSRTVDFDPDQLEDAQAAAEQDEITKPEVAHPHVKRRR
jgi:hypothetical protein